MGIRLRTFAGLLLLLVPAAAQTTTSFEISHVDGKWYGRNLSNQPITGYVIHTGYEPCQVNLSRINCVPAELEWHPIASGAVAELTVKPGFAAVDVPAVILGDGSVVGAARTIEGMDVVEGIFDLRQGEAQELARWLKIVQQSNSHQALLDFRREANQVGLKPTPGDMRGSGIAAAAALAASQTAWLDRMPGSEADLQAKLVERIKGWAVQADRLSQRSAR